MSGSSKFLKVCLRLLVFLGVLGFLIVEANDRHGNGGRGFIRATGVVKTEGVAGIHRKQEIVEAVSMGRRMLTHRVVSKFELSYFSKRRVPNGPDPIHNRRAGNSHRPPGHA